MQNRIELEEENVKQKKEVMRKLIEIALKILKLLHSRRKIPPECYTKDANEKNTKTSTLAPLNDI